MNSKKYPLVLVGGVCLLFLQRLISSVGKASRTADEYNEFKTNLFK